MQFFRVRKKKRPNLHFTAHKEFARTIIHERLKHWNTVYGFSYGRVAIRNQKRCWGSCSAKRNLNFNYKIVFLPTELMDYVIVHELCHLAEMNHSQKFWDVVARALPDYKTHRTHLRRITNIPAQGFPSSIRSILTQE